jgi:putative transposase
LLAADADQLLFQETRQCLVLNISRSSAYRKLAGAPADDIDLMPRPDELPLKCPFKGSLRLLDDPWDSCSLQVNRKRIQRLMRLRALYPGAKMTRRNPQHKVYPYLLRELKINRVNQVWCTGLTYIPMRQGFVYLVAIMDWHSRQVLSWRLFNALDAAPCVEAREEALANHGTPEVFNNKSWFGVHFNLAVFSKVIINFSPRISIMRQGISPGLSI